ncbi:MAG TPA: hypothetical protein VGN60_06620 [Devosia sp.]|jgi:hypothetical protein|nr:hypothetical protein [Devosia sp.]
MSKILGDVMVSLSNHEVQLAGVATTSSFDKLRMRSTAILRWRGWF